MALDAIELIAYLGVLILCIVAFVQVSRGYKASKEKLEPYDIIDLAKIFMLTFGFIIIKLTIDYIAVFGYLSDSMYGVISLVTTIVILFGILYSVKVLIDLTRTV